MITELNIGDIVLCYPPLMLGKATCIYIFLSGRTPDRKLIDKYYKPNLGKKFPEIYKKPIVNIYVLKRDVPEDAYIILPGTKANFGMLRKIYDTLLILQDGDIK